MDRPSEEMSALSDREKLAQSLLSLQAITVRPERPFTWSSGIVSPIYCDMRRVMTSPAVRRSIVAQWTTTIERTVPNTEVIAGTATAGIPHAAWLAERLSLPMVYVRSKPKAHGTQSRIEGMLTPGANVVLVEDLISTGGSALQAVAALREAGAIVEVVVAIFSYGFARATEAFAQAGVRAVTLCDLDALLPVAIAHGVVTDPDTLFAWKQQVDGQQRSSL